MRDFRKTAQKELKKKTGTYTNKNTGESAKLTKGGIEKLISGKAVYMSTKNGFTAKQHFEAVKKINLLYKKSVFVKSEPDYYGRKDIKSFRKYEATFKTKNRTTCNVYITIKETVQNGNSFYSLELKK
ncbi:MAG: hypothetical protein UHO11_07650 [Treponema sp.]|nr:hypothetical protein [Treponema sp.]